MNQEQNIVKKTKANICRVELEPGQIIRVVHPVTGTVVDIAIDLSPAKEAICFRCISDELNIAWDAPASRFIDSLLFGIEV
jgi:hypothetical protein